MKILGIYFTCNWRLKQKLNFDAILHSLKKSLNVWQWRNLSIMSKVQLIKIFVLPKFMYHASVINLDKAMIKKLNSIVYNVLWKGKDKIKRLALISDYKDGGLRMLHIKSAIVAVELDTVIPS